MSRFVLLDSGEELSDATLAALRSAPPPVRLRLCEPARPFRTGQIVHLSREGSGPGRARDVLLCRAGREFSLCMGRDAPVNGEVLGRVVAVERGTARVSLERGLLARVPARWLPQAVDALEVLARFRHPLTPPLFQGSAEAAFFSECLQHIPGRALRIDTLRRVACALAPDGVLILSVMYRGPFSRLSRTRLAGLLRVLGARLFGPRRFSEPGDGWIRDVSEASDSRAPVFFHDFSGAGDVRREIEAAGFRAHEVRSGWWVCRTASDG